jgi:hypothetical protein
MPPKILLGLCKKAASRLLAACAANNYFEGTLFSIISRSEMIENNVPSKFYFAAVGGKILFIQPHTFCTTSDIQGLFTKNTFDPCATQGSDMFHLFGEIIKSRVAVNLIISRFKKGVYLVRA